MEQPSTSRTITPKEFIRRKKQQKLEDLEEETGTIKLHNNI
jgi:hypothetical protein